jgi:hypothetical protein
MMAGYCRNMYEPVRRIKEWYNQCIFLFSSNASGARGGAVVEALRYKPEGRGIEARWCNWNFYLHNLSGRHWGRLSL